MTSGDTSFPAWLVTIVVLAVAIAFVAVDPAGLASGFAGREMGLFRALDPIAVIRDASSIPAQILLLEIVGAALALLIAARRPLLAIVVAVAAAVVAQIVSLLVYAHLHVAFELANAGAGLVVAALAGAMACLAAPERSARLAATKPRPTAPVAAAASETPPASVLGAETMTSLSCSLLRLPALAESFGSDGQGLLHLVETAIGALVEDATGNGAALSRFDGASFAAHWRAGQTPAHADRACDSAARMIETTGKINAALAEKWPNRDRPCPVVEFAIGIASGPVLAGHVRSHGSQTTLVVSGREPTPERLAERAALYGAAALASEDTRAAAGRAHAFLEVDFCVLDRGGAPARLYALQGNALLRASPKFRAVATFHERIFQAIAAREWQSARELIAQARNLSGASARLYDLHLARISWYEANPPPQDWDGAFRAELG